MNKFCTEHETHICPKTLNDVEAVPMNCVRHIGFAWDLVSVFSDLFMQPLKCCELHSVPSVFTELSYFPLSVNFIQLYCGLQFYIFYNYHLSKISLSIIQYSKSPLYYVNFDFILKSIFIEIVSLRKHSFLKSFCLSNLKELILYVCVTGFPFLFVMLQQKGGQIHGQHAILQMTVADTGLAKQHEWSSCSIGSAAWCCFAEAAEVRLCSLHQCTTCAWQALTKSCPTSHEDKTIKPSTKPQPWF